MEFLSTITLISSFIFVVSYHRFVHHHAPNPRKRPVNQMIIVLSSLLIALLSMGIDLILEGKLLSQLFGGSIVGITLVSVVIVVLKFRKQTINNQYH